MVGRGPLPRQKSSRAEWHARLASRSGDLRILAVQERRATDFEVPKLWKGSSGGPTDPFTIPEPHDKEISEFCFNRERRATDFWNFERVGWGAAVEPVRQSMSRGNLQRNSNTWNFRNNCPWGIAVIPSFLFAESLFPTEHFTIFKLKNQ